jgi:hypothetical protein
LAEIIRHTNSALKEVEDLIDEARRGGKLALDGRACFHLDSAKGLAADIEGRALADLQPWAR